jgi:AraC-like DNA-binding protein
VISDAEIFQRTHAASGLPPVLSKQHDGGEFRADIVARELGSLKLVELVTPAGECFRDASCARAVDEELWQIELMAQGRSRVEQGRGTADLEAADLVLVDPARPVAYTSTAARHVTLLVPRRELRLRPGDAARLVGVRIDGHHGPGALVSALVQDMARSLTGFRPDEADRSAAAVIELVSVALKAQLYDVGAAPDQALRNRVVGYIEARLSDRDLAPAQIAAAHHISVRRLHKLFEDEPLTVAALIRQRRLERCRADLAGSDRTVAAVAARWGFADPAHFSRLFKATFGYNAALISSNRARTVNAPAARPGENVGGPQKGESPVHD